MRRDVGVTSCTRGTGGPPCTRIQSSPAASATNAPSGASARRLVQTATKLLQQPVAGALDHVEDLFEALATAVVGVRDVARSLGVPLAQQAHLGVRPHPAQVR